MYNEGSAEFNELINKSGGNALITRFTFSDFSIEKFTKLEYYGGSNNSDDIAIGTTNMAYLDVGTVTDKIITNQEFLFEVGMELSDGTIEYAPMGYFKVQSPDSDEDIVNFKAYDRMQKFEKPYTSSLTYPTNSSQILNELCATCGVELATPIANAIAITDKLEGYTCREVLGYIAGIHGFFACFDRYGKLNLRWYSETPIEKQIGLIWALTKSQGNYTVEKITLAKDTETTYTSGTGISGINHSNPYGTQEIADSIYTSLGNFTYRPCEISILDDIRLDPWDMLKVTYLDGSVLTIPVMSLEHSFTSGETRVKSFGKTDTENEYSYSGPVTQAMDRMSTELLVANRIIATKVDAEWVNAHTVTADKIEATNARVDDLETNSLTVKEADLRYANITLANIDTANIDVTNIGLLFAKVGLIDRATIVDGHITGFLDAVEINASNITAGTLIADRILLKGSESGLLYALNNLGELTSTEVDTLDGTILTQRTVTADKLVANSITANELDVTNIFGNSAVLSTLVSQEAFINAISTNKVVVGAYNKSQSIIDNIYSPGTTTIDGGKITTESITANKLFVKELTSLSSNIAGFQIKGGNPIYPLLATIKSGSFIQNADGSWTLKGSIGFPQVPYIGDTVVFTFLYQALDDIVNLEITISGSYNGVNLNDKVISLQLLSPTGGDYSVLKKDCGVLQLTDSSGALKTPSLVTITITSDKLLNIEEMHVSGLVSDGRITYNTDSFATDDDSLYISNNGISLGKNFSVTNTGYAQMSSGKIGGFEIAGTALRGGYPLTDGHNYTFDLNPTNLKNVGSDILSIVDRYYSSGAEQFRIGGLRVYTADSAGSIKVEARNFECTNLLEAYQIKSTADITSVGDIIAGIGTNNAVSLLSHTHSYLPLSGGVMKGDLNFANSGTTSRGIYGTVGDNDYWRMIGGATASNAGYLEISTADDGTEPIYVRQYTGSFANIARTATLLDGSGNTSFPGKVTASGGLAITDGSEDKNMGFFLGLDSNGFGGGGNVKWITKNDVVSAIGAIPKSCHWDMGTGYYADNDTHWCELGYIDFNGGYDTIVLLITTEFWGNQHGSGHILYIRGTASSGSLYFTTRYMSLENGNRLFKHKKVGDRLYLYMYHVGGNSYARIGITQLQALSVNFTPEYVRNVSISECSDFEASDTMSCGVYVQSKTAIAYDGNWSTISNVSLPTLYFGDGEYSYVRTVIRGHQIYLSSNPSYDIATNTRIMNISDARLKNDIEELNADYENTDKFISLWDRISPKEFKMKYNDSKLHIGYVAQDFIEEMEKLGLDYENAPIIGISTNEQIGKDGFNSIDENSEYFDELYTVDYNECAMLTTLKLKQVVNEILPMMQKEINTLKEQNELLKEQIALLKEAR